MNLSSTSAPLASIGTPSGESFSAVRLDFCHDLKQGRPCSHGER